MYAQYKLLTHLLWGSYSFAKWRENRVKFANGPLCRHFGFHPARLKKYVDWLEKHGMIDNVKREFGSTGFRVIIPENLKNLGFTVESVRGGKDA